MIRGVSLRFTAISTSICFSITLWYFSSSPMQHSSLTPCAYLFCQTSLKHIFKWYLNVTYSYSLSEDFFWFIMKFTSGSFLLFIWLPNLTQKRMEERGVCLPPPPPSSSWTWFLHFSFTIGKHNGFRDLQKDCCLYYWNTKILILCLYTLFSYFSSSLLSCTSQSSDT